ncbi:MAG: hypothetical protein LYZ69_07055 [Nitrososphaerales archaeon]|nr:hypothetical protein [Nitrososphaerales archaeon]
MSTSSTVSATCRAAQEDKASLEKARGIFAEDFGTSEYKFGPAVMGETPDAIETRGYFPDTRGFVQMVSPDSRHKLLVVGPQVSNYLEAKVDLAERLVYPLRYGLIREDDERAWSVLKELVRYGLIRHRYNQDGSKGAKCVAALSSAAPRYMYERLFDLHQKINEEEGKRLVSAISIIPQPPAVAISQKKLACTVLEGGHGNTQVAPIGNGVIFNALIGLQRGGADCDLLTAEVLKDAGYADLATEPKLVKLFKEAVGLIPKDLKAVMEDKSNEAFDVTFSIPKTKIKIELGKDSWQRFLMGEYFFKPSEDVFSSYRKRGTTKPRFTEMEGEVILSETDLADVITMAIDKVSFELQPSLYQNIFLSGGNFSWKVPPGMEDHAIGAPKKLKDMLKEKGVTGTTVELTRNPIFNVWQGSVAYGMYIPDDFAWDWQAREGWMFLDAKSPQMKGGLDVSK